MSWLTDLGTYLQTQNIGTLGTNMFYGGFRASVTNCISLLEQPGLPQKNSMSGDMQLSRPEFGVKVRNSDGSAAKAIADSIHELLKIRVNATIGNTHFKRIEAISKPFTVSSSETGGFIYSVNFSLEINE